MVIKEISTMPIFFTSILLNQIVLSALYTNMIFTVFYVTCDF